MPRGPTVMLTGATGYLGPYLVAALRSAGLEVRCAGRVAGADVHLDLADLDSVRAAVGEARPDVVLHAGAMSALGACEREPAQARTVNAYAAVALCEVAPRVVQVSTDLVFGGGSAPYAASDPPRPRNVYGQTKAAAETAVLAADGLVVRIPLLFGRSASGRAGATDMVRAAAGQELRLFSNEFRTPLHTADAARLLAELVVDGDARGVLHLAGRERVSRHELGLRFARAVGLPEAGLVAVSCEDDRRPRDVSLRSDRDCGRDLDAALAEC